MNGGEKNPFISNWSKLEQVSNKQNGYITKILSIVKKFLHALFDKIQHIGTHH
jgi:hypothetical protein